MQSIGSIWRKWDLHIHTPASYEWRGQKFSMQNPLEAAEACKAISEQIQKSDVDAFCIMDYWTFDGFIALRDYVNRNPTSLTKRVFPGIEIRLEAPTDYRLNTHVVFDDCLSNEKLAHFLARLSIGGRKDTPPSRENFIEIGRGYDNGKLRLHGYSPDDRTDNDKMYLVGIKTAVVSRQSLEDAMLLVGKDSCLIVQPYGTNDGLEGLDWKQHPFTDSELMKWADIFETRNSLHVGLFLGEGHPKKPHVGEEFIQNLGGKPKPAVSGSDAHRISDYGVYPSDRMTWLKAQPHFTGLKQVCHEPSLRCFVGLNPSKREHVAQNPTKYMREVRIDKVTGSSLDEHWFDKLRFELNPGLVAIIGNKGSGKSALADILALTGNSHCKQMEFLNEQRFRHGENKATHFCAGLSWMDGSPATELTLDKNTDSNRPERVRYLPQQFIENLCNEIDRGDESSFNQELKKVIFSHVLPDQRLGKGNLDELIFYRIASFNKAISQTRSKLRGINEEIVKIEQETTREKIDSYKTALALRRAELEAHDKTRPPEEQPPVDDASNPEAQKIADSLVESQRKLDEKTKELEAAVSERTQVAGREALAARLAGHLENFENSFKTFIEDTDEDFTSAGLDVTKIVVLSVNRQPVIDFAESSSTRLEELARVVEGHDATKGLDAICGDYRVEIESLRSRLNAPQQKYQKYLADFGRWNARRLEVVGGPTEPGSIEFLQSRIGSVELALPARLAELTDQRRQCVRDIHLQLTKVRQVYGDLYKPVQDMAAATGFTEESIQLHFDAFLIASGFEVNFLDFIHRNRRGNFYGETESAKLVEDILSRNDFNSNDGIIRFLDEMMTLLTVAEKDGTKETLAIQSQLKAGKKLGAFYDFLFGLEYVEPRYTLKLGEKPISQLSPGEKGALLLVFYLLLDREEIPIIIDQPEQNLDNESVVRLLVGCIRKATARRQVIIVTHNPNLAVVCDADQLICVKIDKADGNRITISSGAIEDNPINQTTVDVLEGTYRAFDNRRMKYHKPTGTR